MSQLKILFIVRDNLFSQQGGDTVQVEYTAKHLEELGHQVSILKSGQKASVKEYDILHFFNLFRPSDILPYLKRNHPPLVVTSIFVDYSEADALRTGIEADLTKSIGRNGTEYLKSFARWLKGSSRFPGMKYLTKGQRRAIIEVLNKTSYLITASHQEYEKLKKEFPNDIPYEKISLGIEHISPVGKNKGSKNSICSVARIELIKNQLNLIEALKDSSYALELIGEPAQNQLDYYKLCKKSAASSVIFSGKKTHQEISEKLQQTKVHAMPSYYETTGLATLEALYSGCQAVISDRGGQEEIFGDKVFYCEPNDAQSIRKAIDEALKSDTNHTNWVKENFSWAKAARSISDIYQSILNQPKS